MPLEVVYKQLVSVNYNGKQEHRNLILNYNIKSTFACETLASRHCLISEII